MSKSMFFLAMWEIKPQGRPLPICTSSPCDKRRALVYASGIEDTRISTQRQLNAQEEKMLHLFSPHENV